MFKGLQWLGLTLLTGSPILSLLLLVVVWALLDRFTLGLLPDPVRAWARFSRVRRLEAHLARTPHDRRARLELGDLLVEQRRFRRALEVLRPNVEAGDDDVYTLYCLGVASYGAGLPADGERFLERARQKEPGFRMNAIDLEWGRGRLGGGGAPAAVQGAAQLRRGQGAPGPRAGEGGRRGGRRPSAPRRVERLRGRALVPETARAVVGVAAQAAPAGALRSGAGPVRRRAAGVGGPVAVKRSSARGRGVAG